MKKAFIITITAVILVLAVTGIASCNMSAENGLSAYEIAVKNGFDGSEQDWLQSLKGTNGIDGNNATVVLSLYNEAVSQGYEGSYMDFLNTYLSTASTNDSSLSAANQGLLSAVSVYASFTQTITGGNPFFGREDQTYSYASAGSGVIIDGDKSTGEAYIVTNFHVIYDSESDNGLGEDITVYLYGMEYSQYAIQAQYIGGSSTYDIAVLKIDSDIYSASSSIPAEIADSDDVTPGIAAIAIGNPEAMGISVTSGIVSVDSEYIEMLSTLNTTTSYRVIRIDTAINSGNSGGGLYNSAGKLIGIVNAKLVSSDVENISYAIPSNIAIGAAYNIISDYNETQNNSLQKCFLGITTTVSDSKAEYDADNCRVVVKQKIVVTEVQASSVAQGIIQQGDILLEATLNGNTKAINKAHTLSDMLLYARQGDIISISLLRNEAVIQVDIVLGSPQIIE